MSSLATAIVLITDASGKYFQRSLSGAAAPALDLAPVGAAETASNTFPPSFTVFKTIAAVSLLLWFLCKIHSFAGLV